ncbi:MAG: hypothetical protein C4527_01665 [Candidatus Omnitrophota bacterium]|jgi:CRISPR/Cas system CSM-associated protein Csm3 (group 7 of RAMP superfamily)|nr:MAG: hypothetical protein C4527_01665 [Candidatus Omnitrophota bacterium]
MSSNKPYRTLFVGKLIQQSSFSVGGNEGGGGSVDDPLCRDGKGRLTLRGSSLAGALIATARKIFNKLPPYITGDPYPKRGNQQTTPSLWRFYTTHPEYIPEKNKEILELRQGVGIRQDTGAAADQVLFDVETLPKGTEWWFCLEVKFPSGDDGLSDDKKNNKFRQAERIAATALMEWEEERCWIGRNVARGLGWMHLKCLKAYRLYASDMDIWPDCKKKSEGKKTPSEITQEFINKERKSIKSDEFDENFDFSKLPPIEKPWYYLIIKGEIIVGEKTLENNQYGLDAISVGGHAADLMQCKWDKEHFLIPDSINNEGINEIFDPDHAFVQTQIDETGTRVPFLPGSGLRGPLRHALSRILRQRGEKVRDPNDDRNDKTTPSKAGKELEELFGTSEESAALLIKDAYLKNGNCKLAWFQHHAEDEFSAGAYESSKFNRIALVEGKFEFKLVIEAKNDVDAENKFKLLKPALKLAAIGYLPIGGVKWRGAGWPRWTFNNDSAFLYIAGEKEWGERWEIFTDEKIKNSEV